MKEILNEETYFDPHLQHRCNCSVFIVYCSLYGVSMTIRIAVVGPESSGKTTTINAIRDAFNCEIVDEIVREYNDECRNSFTDVTRASFWEVLRRYKRSLEVQGELVVQDSDPMFAVSFFVDWYGKDCNWVKPMTTFAASAMKQYDLVFVMAPTIPFVQDGTRDESIHARLGTYFTYCHMLAANNVKHIHVTSRVYHERTNQVLQAITKVITDKYVHGGHNLFRYTDQSNVASSHG